MITSGDCVAECASARVLGDVVLPSSRPPWEALNGSGALLLGRVCLMILSALSLAAAVAERGEPALSPYAVGGGVLLILLAVMGVLVAFGGGREHS